MANQDAAPRKCITGFRLRNGAGLTFALDWRQVLNNGRPVSITVLDSSSVKIDWHNDSHNGADGVSVALAYGLCIFGTIAPFDTPAMHPRATSTQEYLPGASRFQGGQCPDSSIPALK